MGISLQIVDTIMVYNGFSCQDQVFEQVFLSSDFQSHDVVTKTYTILQIHNVKVPHKITSVLFIIKNSTGQVYWLVELSSIIISLGDFSFTLEKSKEN